MRFLILDGKYQSVTTLVTFTDEAGKPYVILGRTDPRYHDKTGECFKHDLKVGPWQFIGGNAEYIEGETREYWDETYPELTNWPDVPDKEGNARPLNKRIASNALKELREESNISVQSFNETDELKDLMVKQGKLTYLRKETFTNRRGPQDVHYLNLDLGKLTKKQIAALKETVRPNDDLIQTIVAPVSELALDERRHMHLSLNEDVKTKTDFDGFPELEIWYANYDEMVKKHPEAKERVEAEKAVLKQIHENIRGLQGVDQESLFSCAPIGFHLGHGRGHKSNGAILEHFLKNTYDIQPPLHTKPDTPQPFCHALKARAAEAAGNIEHP